MPPRRSSRAARLAGSLVLAALAGVLVAGAYPPVGPPWLAVPGIALLTVVTWRVRAGRAALLGLVTGLAWFGFTLSWVQTVALAAWPGLALVEAGYLALLGAALALLSRLPGAPWWQACAWAAVESLRGWWPFGGFPWARLSHAVLDTPLERVVPQIGLAGTTAVIALLGCSLGALLVSLLRTRRAWPTVAALGGPVAVAVAVLLLPAPGPLSGADPEPPLRVALVQGDTPGVGVEAMAQMRAVLENHVAATRVLAREVRRGGTPRPDLVVWPENASDVDPFADAGAYADISAAVRAVGAPAITGIVVGRDGSGTWSNRAQVWSADGRPGSFYDKRHPVPFGEYIPLRSLLAPLVPALDQIPTDMRPGIRSGVLEVADTEVGVLMCFETADESLVRDVVEGGARLVVVPTNNATYMGTPQVEQQLDISRVTALATARPVLVAATNGITAAIAPDGTVTDTLPVRTPAVLAVTVRPSTVLTPAVRRGDAVSRGLAVATLLGLLLAVGPRRAQRLRRERAERTSGT